MEMKSFNQKVLETLFDCAVAYSGLLPFDYQIKRIQGETRIFHSLPRREFFALDRRKDQIACLGFL